MNPFDITKYAFDNLMHRKLRSWLTVLSIMIGIMAIFALVSFGAGLQKYINSLSEEMGKDKLIISSKGFTAPGGSSFEFSDNDVHAIESVNGIKTVAPIEMSSAEIRDSPDSAGKWYYIIGVPLESGKRKLINEGFTLKLDSGRELKQGDRYKVVLGANYQKENKIFSKPVKLRDTVYIKGVPFKVVGFYQEMGNPNDDGNVYLPIDTAKEILGKNDYQMILASTDSGSNPSDVAEKVKARLRRERNQDPGKEDFEVQTFEEAIAVFTNIVDILNAVLVMIALISVVVSAINIANAMYTAVIERTNEIGVMKAIGARNSAIRLIFLIESGMLGFVGGAIGIFFGYLVATTGGALAANAGYSLLQPYFPWWLIAGCLVFAFMVGMLSGYFPAKNASQLRPVDALRYE